MRRNSSDQNVKVEHRVVQGISYHSPHLLGKLSTLQEQGRNVGYCSNIGKMPMTWEKDPCIAEPAPEPAIRASRLQQQKNVQNRWNTPQRAVGQSVVPPSPRDRSMSPSPVAPISTNLPTKLVSGRPSSGAYPVGRDSPQRVGSLSPNRVGSRSPNPIGGNRVGSVSPNLRPRSPTSGIKHSCAVTPVKAASGSYPVGSSKRPSSGSPGGRLIRALSPKQDVSRATMEGPAILKSAQPEALQRVRSVSINRPPPSPGAPSPQRPVSNIQVITPRVAEDVPPSPLQRTQSSPLPNHDPAPDPITANNDAISIVKRSASTPHAGRQPTRCSLTPRAEKSKQSSHSRSPCRGVDSASPRTAEDSSNALGAKPRIKASLLAWLEDVLRPQRRAARRRNARPPSLPGADDDVPYESLEFDSRIGSGSFGDVWKGTFQGEVVAMKQCKINDDNEAGMLLLEIAYLKKLRHPRLVSLLGCCRRSPNIIILMEFMPGGSLHHLLFPTKKKNGTAVDAPKQNQRGLSFEFKAKMAWQVAEGIVYLHARDVVHRDLKTHNIVLDAELNCKICDFGLTITLEKTHFTVKSPEGSPRYMAPEQLEPKSKISEKVDIWQMGCVMLELFCLCTPFANASGFQQICTELLVRKRPPSIPTFADPRARVLVQACLKIQPSLRVSAEALVEALAGLCGESGAVKD